MFHLNWVKKRREVKYPRLQFRFTAVVLLPINVYDAPRRMQGIPSLVLPVWANHRCANFLHTSQIGPTTCHCCLAPCKSVTNYGPLTEPKFCIVKCALTQIPTSNGHISETKRRILYPLVPKFSSDRGLSPTLS